MSGGKRHSERRWATAPISPTCETLCGRVECGGATTHAYPALRGGWAAICERHATNVLPYCTPLPDLLAAGEELAVRR
jgi:hypothetical protein